MKRWIVGFALLGVLAPAAPAQAQETVISFTEQAAPYGRGGQCWEWSDTWYVYNGFGRLKFAPAEHLIWCANRGGTLVQNLDSNGCWNAAGYWTFDGCSKWHSASGYDHMRVVNRYAYEIDLRVTTVHTQAVIDQTIYPDGRISGEFTVG